MGNREESQTVAPQDEKDLDNVGSNHEASASWEDDDGDVDGEDPLSNNNIRPLQEESAPEIRSFDNDEESFNENVDQLRLDNDNDHYLYRSQHNFEDERHSDLLDQATWEELFRACCRHSCAEWFSISIGVFVLLIFLYFFLLGLDLLAKSASVVSGCTAGSLFGDDFNPISALMVGILTTVLLQSSSTTTSVIVSLVAGGLDTQQAIYMVMGANIGTSITNTIVALVHAANVDELERAFAGATLHDMFNFLSVLTLFPIEIATGYLYRITRLVLPKEVGSGGAWEGPIKKVVAPLAKKIIIHNESLIKSIALQKMENCDAYYPVACTNGILSHKTCAPGLIACDKRTNSCPAFFQDGATKNDDIVSGGVCIFMALMLLIISLIGLFSLLQRLFLGASARVIYKATNINGYLAMAIGCGITILVQSSSITTSTLIPFIGSGVLHLEQMFPLTLGANIGTTCTALMASLVSDKVESLQAALAHLFFNITGIILWYPIPWMRRVPLTIARRLGRFARRWRGFPILYVPIVFFLLPFLVLGLDALIESERIGLVVLGFLITAILVVALLYVLYWWNVKKGHLKWINWMEERHRRRELLRSLPEELAGLRDEISRLKFATGLTDETTTQIERGATTNNEEEQICSQELTEDALYDAATSQATQ